MFNYRAHFAQPKKRQARHLKGRNLLHLQLKIRFLSMSGILLKVAKKVTARQTLLFFSCADKI